MARKVSDLTVVDLKTLIAEIVHDSIEDVREDFAALSSPSYLQSIQESRAQYGRGECVSLDEIERA